MADSRWDGKEAEEALTEMQGKPKDGESFNFREKK
jgi:hypothetical protein